MSKKTSSKNNCSSSDNELYQVQKIINQRTIDGKKQYKVIWKGYAFQEATWEPQQNLNCPQKITQFIRRYQDVIRKKNLVNKNPNLNINPNPSINSNTPKSQPIVPTSQQKIPLNNYPIPNNQRSQTPNQKMLITKKNPDIQNLKSKIMTPQNNQNRMISQQQKLPVIKQQSSTQIIQNVNSINSTTLDNKQNIPYNQNFKRNLKDGSEGLTSSTTQDEKIAKFQNQPSKKAESTVDKIFSKDSLKIQIQSQQQNASQVPMRRQETEIRRSENNEFGLYDFGQQRKISSVEYEEEMASQRSQSQFGDQQLFVSIGQKLDIQRICGIVNLALQAEILNKKGDQKIIYEPQSLFLVKNRFSDKQKIVSRSRIMSEQPLKLINYYESLLSQ